MSLKNDQRIIASVLTTCLLCLFLTPPSQAAEQNDFVRVSGQDLMLKNEKFNIKGVNHMDMDSLWYTDRFEPADDWITENDFILLKNLGLNTVRLPLKSDYFQSPGPSYAWRESSFVWLDEIIGWADKHGIYLILDMHIPTGGVYQDYQIHPANQIFWQDDWMRGRFVDVWREIAKRYAQRPGILAYDLMNEPATLDFDKYQKLMRSTARAIREHDVNHALIIQPGMYVKPDQSWDFAYPQIPDPQIIRSVHYYLPTEFSLQGASWLASNATQTLFYPGLTLPGQDFTWDDQKILKNLKSLKAKAQADAPHPVIMSEFGTIFTDRRHGQLFWINDAIRAAAQLDMGWIYWYFKGPSLTGTLSITTNNMEVNWPALHVLRRAAK